MELVSNTAGKETFILGCGAPLGSVIGHVNANRISSDAGMSWFPEWPLPRNDCWNLPCARNMVKNTLSRLFMHNEWWINDPDCVLLRDKLHFSEQELIGIATTKAFSGGSFVISDDLDAVSSDRMRIFHQLLPPTDIPAVALDLLEREIPEVLRLRLAPSPSPAPSAMTTRRSKGEGRDCLVPRTLLAMCNWGDTSVKEHILGVRDLLGADYCDDVVVNGEEEDVVVFEFDFWKQELSYGIKSLLPLPAAQIEMQEKEEEKEKEKEKAGGAEEGTRSTPSSSSPSPFQLSFPNIPCHSATMAHIGVLTRSSACLPRYTRTRNYPNPIAY